MEKLDQDKGIWVFYDYPCFAFEPYPDGIADKEEARNFAREGVKVGDYYINAG